MHVQIHTYIGDPLHFFFLFFFFTEHNEFSFQVIILYGTRGIVERIAGKSGAASRFHYRRYKRYRTRFLSRYQPWGRIKITCVAAPTIYKRYESRLIIFTPLFLSMIHHRSIRFPALLRRTMCAIPAHSIHSNVNVRESKR